MIEFFSVVLSVMDVTEKGFIVGSIEGLHFFFAFAAVRIGPGR